MENPFCDPNHIPWLQREEVLRMACRLDTLAERYPWLRTMIPWLTERALSRLTSEALEGHLWPHRTHRMTIIPHIQTWFRPLTRPLATAAQALFTAALPRTVVMVDEIFRRWARAAGKRPIPCSRLMALGLLSPYQSGSLPQEIARTWQIEIRSVDCRLPGRTGRPWLIRVCDKQKTLLFRLLPHRPTATIVAEFLYEALTTTRATVVSPAHLVVPAPIPRCVATFARSQGIAVTESRTVSPPLQLRSARCASVSHLARLVDQYCEQEGGFAPTHEALAQRWQMGNELWVSSLYPIVLTQATDLLPRYHVRVSPTGTIHWGEHEYHDGPQQLLRWFANDVVQIRPLPQMDTVLLVEWCGEALALGMAEGSAAGRTIGPGEDLLLRRWTTSHTHLGGWPEGAGSRKKVMRISTEVTVKPTKRTNKVLRMTQKVTRDQDNESHTNDR